MFLNANPISFPIANKLLSLYFDLLESVNCIDLGKFI
jgi:hypothetical protein